MQTMAQDDMLHAFAPDAFDIYALFERYGEMDAVCIFRNKSLGSYYMLLHKYEKAYTTKLSKEQAEVLNFISLKFGEGKRPHELELLDILLHEPHHVWQQLVERLQKGYQLQLSAQAKQNIINIMTGNFLTGSSRNSFQHAVFLQADGQGDYEIAGPFQTMLYNEEFRHQVEELLSLCARIKTTTMAPRASIFFLAAGIPIGDGEFLIWEGKRDMCPFTPAQVVRIM